MHNIETSKSGKTYKYVQKLGSGTYGTTWMAIDQDTGEKITIKVFSRPGKLDQEKIEDITEDWEIEVGALKKVLPQCSPSAVCIKDYWFGKDGAKIAMDFIRGESLNKQIIGGIRLAARRNDHTLLKNLIDGIQVIHNKGIVHQDIKGDNIMFDFDYPQGLYRYIDFGLSCIQKAKKIKKVRDNWPCGSIGTRYTAPHEIATVKNGVTLDWNTLEAHDYWSIGVVLLRWYTFDGSRYYYSSIIDKYAKTQKAADKLANESNAYSIFPYYYKFPQMLICNEVGKIKEPSVRAIVGLLLEKNPKKRWENFKTVKYILDPTAELCDKGKKGEWIPIKASIEKLRL